MKNTSSSRRFALSLSHSLLSLSCTQVLETELIDQETLLRIQKIMQSAQAAGTCDSVNARMWVGRGGEGGMLTSTYPYPRPHRHPHSPTLVVAGTEIIGEKNPTAHPLALAH